MMRLLKCRGDKNVEQAGKSRSSNLPIAENEKKRGEGNVTNASWPSETKPKGILNGRKVWESKPSHPQWSTKRKKNQTGDNGTMTTTQGVMFGCRLRKRCSRGESQDCGWTRHLAYVRNSRKFGGGKNGAGLETCNDYWPVAPEKQRILRMEVPFKKAGVGGHWTSNGTTSTRLLN